jgi:hypothetical protein
MIEEPATFPSSGFYHRSVEFGQSWAKAAKRRPTAAVLEERRGIASDAGVVGTMTARQFCDQHRCR